MKKGKKDKKNNNKTHVNIVRIFIVIHENTIVCYRNIII